jgi:hypothetical protein
VTVPKGRGVRTETRALAFLPILLIMLFCAAAIAQDLPKIAVGVAGNAP